MFNHLRKKIVSLMLLVLLATQSASAIEAYSSNKDNNLTNTQLHAVMGIITNFILSSDSGASNSSGVSDVVVKHTVGNSYKVTWKGNSNAQTWVTYSGSSTANKISATGNEYIYRHLSPDITFTLYVQGVGSDTLITKVFRTEAPVELESAPTLEIGSDSVIIKFIANQNAQGQIEYGTSTDYGSETTKESSFNYSSHTQTLTNLEAGTTYHYRVHFWNEDGVETISDDYSFIALSETERNKLTELETLASSIENIPDQYKNDPRWFLLDTDKNPQRPWANDDEISVWAFALVKGEAPNREWLVYAQSPSGDVSDITVTIPGYGDVLVDGSETGSFYVLSERNDEKNNIGTNNTIQITNIQHGSGTTYYFDATNGSDSYSGLSEATAWQTLSKIYNLKLFPGDNLLFKRGEKWDSSRIINYHYSSGTQDNPILFSAYGDKNDDKPIITSLSNLDLTWSSNGNNIWIAPVSKTILRLLQNNSEILKARTLDELSARQPWHYTDNKLYLYSLSNPSELTFQASKQYMTMYLFNQKFISVNNLQLDAGETASIVITGSSNIHINNCKLGSYAGHGIYITNSDENKIVKNILIENSIFDSSYTLDYKWITPGGRGASYVGASDGLSITKGIQDSVFKNNFFKNWNHASIAMESSAEESTTRNQIFNNTLTAPDIAYGGRIAVSGENVYENEIYGNLIKNIAIRNQFGGHNNHFHHNVINGVTNSPLKPGNLGQCLALEAYNGNVFDNIIEYNTFKNCEGAGIKLIATGRDDTYISDNIFKNNIIENCGFNTYDASEETDIFIENFSDIKEQVFENNLISSEKIKYKGNLINISKFNNQTSNISNNTNFSTNNSVGAGNESLVGSTINY